jgi:hypothetical protein
VALGDPQRARSQTTELWRRCERLHGPGHPLTLVHRLDDAVAWYRAGYPSQARELAAAVNLELTEVLGPGHPYTLWGLMNEGVCLADSADPRARTLLRLAEAGLTRALGRSHPDTMIAEANVLLHSNRGTPDPHLRLELLADLGERLGDDHPAVVAFRSGEFQPRMIDPYPI